MKPIVSLAAISLLVLTGCAPEENLTTKAVGAKSAVDARAASETAKCSKCGGEFAKKDMHDHDGKLTCAACDSH